MGHDLHFLERLDRLDAAQVGFAFSLYRNAALVQQLLTHVATAGTGRVAIALTEEPEPPHVLVARNGHFVTCLAAGMRHELPVISRAAVDRARRDHEALRLAFEAAEALRDDGGYSDLVMRLQHGPRVSREEMREVMQWAPAVSSTLAGFNQDSLVRHIVAWTEVKSPEALKEKHAAHVSRLWRTAWHLGHLVGPVSTGMRHVYGLPDPSVFRGHFAMVGLHTHLPATALRGCWATAAVGDLAIDDLEKTFLHSPEWLGVWSAGPALVATGLRWPSLRARVAATLARTPALLTEANTDEEDLAFFARLRDVLARPKAALERHLSRATDELGAKVGDVAELDATTLLAASFYAEQPLTEFEHFLQLVDALAFVAASEFADLYLPRAVLDRFPPEDLAASARTYVEERRSRQRRDLASAPLTPAPLQAGRNEPCPCGSARKFKKCCGA